MYLKLSHFLLMYLLMQLEHKMNSLFQFYHDPTAFGSPELEVTTLQRHCPNESTNLCELLHICVHH